MVVNRIFQIIRESEKETRRLKPCETTLHGTLFFDMFCDAKQAMILRLASEFAGVCFQASSGRRLAIGAGLRLENGSRSI